MKNIFKILFVFIIIFLVSGCKSEKEIVKKCELNSNQSKLGYSLKSKYEVHAKGDVVNKVITKEVITTTNTKVLDTFDKYLKDTYKESNDKYGGYKYKLTRKDNKITSDVTIDYNKMNIKKFIKDNSAVKDYTNKVNKITLDGVIKMYEKLGATCN